MSPTLITTIIGLALAAMTLGQAAPSLYATLIATKSSNDVSREALLVQQVIRYAAAEGEAPTGVSQLIAKGYWSDVDNANGFGGSYEFTVDAAKNQIAVTTTIPDAAARAQYIANSRHVFRPVDVGGGKVSSTHVIPTLVASGAPVVSSGPIQASSTAPDPAKNLYWYDTSGSTPALKVSTGSGWMDSPTPSGSTQGSTNSSGVAAASASNMVSSAAALPSTAAEGEVRYVYDAATQTVQTVFYSGGSWVKAGSGENAPIALALAEGKTVLGRVSASYSFDFKPFFSSYFVNTRQNANIDVNQVTWAIQGSLPGGMTFNTATGVLSGTPTVKTPAPPTGQTITVVAVNQGRAAAQNYSLLVSPPTLRARSVSVGQQSACAVDTSGALTCWGSNTNLRLANTIPTQSVVPVAANVLTSNVASVSVGQSHACAVKTDGTVWCWGGNLSSQGGRANTSDSATPIEVPVGGAASLVSAGAFSTCVSMVAGGVKCWGTNAVGALGNGNTTTTSTPQAVLTITGQVKDLSVGSDFACAINSTNQLYCWGGAASGKLGNGQTTGTFSSPVPINIPGGASKVKAGTTAACALSLTGAIYCWGTSSFQFLDDISTSRTFSTPYLTKITSGAIDVSIGSNYSCATMSSGEVVCSGRNVSCELGIGNCTGSFVPMTTLLNREAAAGPIATFGASQSACFVTPSQEVRCWGANNFGQVGDGTSGVARSVPTEVLMSTW